MEKWKDITGYEGYEVSNRGKVKNMRGRLLKPMGDSGRVVLRRIDGNRTTASVRYLVANAFVPNPDPDELCFVAYINGDKNDNRAENLEWQSHPQKRKVLCVETGEVYRSINEAAREKYICSSSISSVCRNLPHHNTAGGYHWEYCE